MGLGLRLACPRLACSCQAAGASRFGRASPCRMRRRHGLGFPDQAQHRRSGARRRQPIPAGRAQNHGPLRAQRRPRGIEAAGVVRNVQLLMPRMFNSKRGVRHAGRSPVRLPGSVRAGLAPGARPATVATVGQGEPSRSWAVRGLGSRLVIHSPQAQQP